MRRRSHQEMSAYDIHCEVHGQPGQLHTPVRMSTLRELYEKACDRVDDEDRVYIRALGRVHLMASGKLEVTSERLRDLRRVVRQNPEPEMDFLLATMVTRLAEHDHLDDDALVERLSRTAEGQHRQTLDLMVDILRGHEPYRDNCLLAFSEVSPALERRLYNKHHFGG